MRYVSTHPNAGLPNAFGEYDETPEEMAGDAAANSPQSGLLNLVGGCCGTTPAHIRAIAEACGCAAQLPRAAHDRRDRPSALRRAGCRIATALRRIADELSMTPATPASPASSRCVITPELLFVNVGERTNVTGSAQFKKLIKEERYEEAVDVARQQVANGAQILDVNMDEGLIDSEKAMTRFLNLIAVRARHRARAGDGRLARSGA